MNISLSDWTFMVGKQTFDKNKVETTIYITVRDVVVSGEHPIQDKNLVQRALNRAGITPAKQGQYTPVKCKILKVIKGL